jgi:hypothetical protein
MYKMKKNLITYRTHLKEATVIEKGGTGLMFSFSTAKRG